MKKAQCGQGMDEVYFMPRCFMTDPLTLQQANVVSAGGAESWKCRLGGRLLSWYLVFTALQIAARHFPISAFLVTLTLSADWQSLSLHVLYKNAVILSLTSMSPLGAIVSPRICVYLANLMSKTDIARFCVEVLASNVCISRMELSAAGRVWTLHRIFKWNYSPPHTGSTMLAYASVFE